MNTETTTEETTTKLPNYRLYDQVSDGSGATEDIYAESLDDAIKQGKEWIEAGDWAREDGVIRRDVQLACCVREIVYRADISALDAAETDYSIERRDDGTLYIDMAEDDIAADLPAVRARLASLATVSDPIDTHDGYAQATITPLAPLPQEIDVRATNNGQDWDCSGSYSDPIPECKAPDGAPAGDDEGGHDWRSPYSLLGGLRDNPGVWGGSGTSMRINTVCRLCGCYRTDHRVGSQRNPGECDTMEIEDRNEASEAWLKRIHKDDHGILPAWLAEMLDCSASTKMTRDEANQYIRAYADDDDCDINEMEHVFAALAGRRATDEERADIWAEAVQLSDAEELK